MITESSNPIRPVETIEKKGVTSKPDVKRLKESQDFAYRFNTVKERVASIMRTDKFSRKNDLWLLLLYYNKMGYIKLKIDVKEFSKITMPESISRARRKIFQDIREGNNPKMKYLLEDQETLDIRNNQEQHFREYFKNGR